MNDSTNIFDLDAETAAGLSAGMQFGGAVELPFLAPLFWAVNGQPQNKAQAALEGGSPALYFGGWMCERATMDEIIQVSGALNGLVSTDFANRQGKEILCYSLRRLILAPIGVRSSWVRDRARSPKYLDGARQHAQILVLLANSSGSGKSTAYQPWGPAVLTAKGYQAQALLDGLKAWNKHTSSWRSSHAPNTPAWAFYLGMGTYGDEPKREMVGKAGAQSPITPLETYLPAQVTDELMHKLFVGRETARYMADLAKQAAEWLHDWDEAVVQPHIEPVDDGPMSNFDEDIPF